MLVAEPLVSSWKARLALRFSSRNGKTVLAERSAEGPLVVQKPLYPEGEAVCHAIVLHPPGGIAGGDELEVKARADAGTAVLLTTPGAGKWYRTAGPWAKQELAFDVEGTLEWLPRETIVFDGALAALECSVRLGKAARYIGWDVVCLGRRGSGESFGRGKLKIDTRVYREDKLLFIEKGDIDAGGRLMRSQAGLGGRSVFGTMMATLDKADMGEIRTAMPENIAMTQLPGLLVARYLGDSGEEALRGFARLWTLLRPAVTGRAAVPPRIWST